VTTAFSAFGGFIRRLGIPEAPDSGQACDARELAARLGVSVEAVELTRACDTIDLHLDTFILPRSSDYDPLRRHAHALGGRHMFGHADVPRLRDGGVSGAMWSITTNPFRSAAERWRVFCENLAAMRAMIARSGGALAEAHTVEEYRAARARGAHVVFPSVQGANAFEAAPDGPASIPGGGIVRATLIHLTHSAFGASSTPWPWPFSRGDDCGLTAAGRRMVEQLNASRILVDLAHAHPKTFWDAVRVHDPSLPFVVTHTGVCGVRPHWRNLDDEQLRAVASSGGVVGIIFATNFLSRWGGPSDVGMVMEHVQHVVDVAGEDFVGLGSDYDGAITAPGDIGSVDAWPRLTQRMLDAGWNEERVRKALGGNFLRVLRASRA
jgi:membrane dipeptidase